MHEGETFAWHIPTMDAPLCERSGVSLAPDDQKIGKRAAEAAGHVVWELATSSRGITTTELNDALLAARPEVFKPDGKRNGSRLSRARADAIKAGYIAEGKRDRLIPGDTKPPEATPGSEFDLDQPLADISGLI